MPNNENAQTSGNHQAKNRLQMPAVKSFDLETVLTKDVRRWISIIGVVIAVVGNILLLFSNADFSAANTVSGTGLGDNIPGFQVPAPSSLMFWADLSLLLIPFLMFLGDHIPGSKLQELAFDISVSVALFFLNYVVFNLSWIFHLRKYLGRDLRVGLSPYLYYKEGDYLVHAGMLVVAIAVCVGTAVFFYRNAEAPEKK